MEKIWYDGSSNEGCESSMSKIDEIELAMNENKERNKKYINEFTEWLKEKGLSPKTINKHVSNVELYVNDYLNYYDITKMEDGARCVGSFLGGWFIEKCMWASRTSIKENAASLKKFYQCMSERGYVKIEDYKDLCEEIKESMDDYLEMLSDFDNGTYFDMFD